METTRPRSHPEGSRRVRFPPGTRASSILASSKQWHRTKRGRRCVYGSQQEKNSNVSLTGCQVDGSQYVQTRLLCTHTEQITDPYSSCKYPPASFIYQPSKSHAPPLMVSTLAFLQTRQHAKLALVPGSMHWFCALGSFSQVPNPLPSSSISAMSSR